MSLIPALKWRVKDSLPESWRNAVSIARSKEPMSSVLSTFAASKTLDGIEANIDVYTHYLRTKASPIVAFEPLPSVNDDLRHRYPEIEAHACTLRDRAGIVDFELDKTQAPIKRLDDFVIAEATTIEIDVEGHEADILKGAVEIARGSAPVLLVEIEERPQPGLSSSIADLIERFDCLRFLLNGHRRVPAYESDFKVLRSPVGRRSIASFSRVRYSTIFPFANRPRMVFRHG